MSGNMDALRGRISQNSDITRKLWRRGRKALDAQLCRAKGIPGGLCLCVIIVQQVRGIVGKVGELTAANFRKLPSFESTVRSRE